MEKVQGFLEKNIVWLLTLIFSLGVNYATVSAKLDSKVSREDVRMIIQEELKSRTYTLMDGKLMELRISNIEQSMLKIDKKVELLLQEKKK